MTFLMSLAELNWDGIQEWVSYSAFNSDSTSNNNSRSNSNSTLVVIWLLIIIEDQIVIRLLRVSRLLIIIWDWIVIRHQGSDPWNYKVIFNWERMALMHFSRKNIFKNGLKKTFRR